MLICQSNEDILLYYNYDNCCLVCGISFFVSKNLLPEKKDVCHVEIQYVLTNNSSANDSILLADQKEILPLENYIMMTENKQK